MFDELANRMECNGKRRVKHTRGVERKILRRLDLLIRSQSRNRLDGRRFGNAFSSSENGAGGDCPGDGFNGARLHVRIVDLGVDVEELMDQCCYSVLEEVHHPRPGRAGSNVRRLP